MNPNTNEFEKLSVDLVARDKRKAELDQMMEEKTGKDSGWNLRYDIGELIQIKGYWFKVKEIQERRIIFTPHGPTR